MKLRELRSLERVGLSLEIRARVDKPLVEECAIEIVRPVIVKLDVATGSRGGLNPVLDAHSDQECAQQSHDSHARSALTPQAKRRHQIAFDIEGTVDKGQSCSVGVPRPELVPEPFAGNPDDKGWCVVTDAPEALVGGLDDEACGRVATSCDVDERGIETCDGSGHSLPPVCFQQERKEQDS